ncbi:hypothetical protein Y032_0001g253 [Ancylostoma ceylanicum]|uniref:Uncharacterized protein n=1 Tax=Ancylostoma ceylanicum TaxID=53326 RepID=A0A016W2Q5_9BILA|nr:hypothetical protein Y032_0001g253 [Ancylostoma ceylanicum]
MVRLLNRPITLITAGFSRKDTVLLEKLDGFCDCTIASRPGRGMLTEHVQGERVEWIPQRFCARNAVRMHTQSVYLSTRTVDEATPERKRALESA